VVVPYVWDVDSKAERQDWTDSGALNFRNDHAQLASHIYGAFAENVNRDVRRDGVVF
jgi:hypothetical protein